MSFSRQPCPVWLFVDLTGNILDDTYYAHFLENTIPYIPQPVYQSADNSAPWSNPLQFNPNGTLPENLYFDDSKVYRIEIRQGPAQTDQLIYLIQNFIPLTGSSDSAVSPAPDNQITNPQFAFTSFVNDYAIVNTGTNIYEIAPGWKLELIGSATMTLTQLTFTGDQNIAGNPSFGLRMAISGTFTSVNLYQRFEETPALWANQNVSVYVLGRANDANRAFTVNYEPSTGAAVPIVNGTLLQNSFTEFENAVLIPASSSTDDGSDGFVDIVFNLPVQGSYDLTNIQAVGTDQELAIADVLPYEQTTVERQRDQTYHVYHESLLRQPKSNLLTGWTFGLNPWQFRATAASNVANNTYTADQTIIIQQAYVTSATANNVQVGRASHTANFAFQIHAVTATNKTMMLQYIDPATIRPYWGEKLSVRLRGSVTTSNATVPRFKVRLMYKAGLPGTVAQTVPVSVWAATDDSIPTISGDGWTYINCDSDPTYTLTSDMQNFNFDGFVLPASTNANMTLGVAFIMMNPLVQTGTPDVINIERVSLVHNDFAIDAAPETEDEALRKCEFYYEKSFDPGEVPGVSTNTANCLERYQQHTSNTTLSTTFGLEYRTPKRVNNPTLTLYAPGTATANRVLALFWRNGAQDAAAAVVQGDFWTAAFRGTKGVVYHSTTAGAGVIATGSGTTNNPEGFINFHYSIDARLGVV